MDPNIQTDRQVRKQTSHLKERSLKMSIASFQNVSKNQVSECSSLAWSEKESLQGERFDVSSSSSSWSSYASVDSSIILLAAACLFSLRWSDHPLILQAGRSTVPFCEQMRRASLLGIDQQSVQKVMKPTMIVMRTKTRWRRWTNSWMNEWWMITFFRRHDNRTWMSNQRRTERTKLTFKRRNWSSLLESSSRKERAFTVEMLPSSK